MRLIRTIAIVSACVLLAACGGGGGGGGGGRSGTLSVASNSLTFTAEGTSASSPAPQLIVGNVTGVSSGTLYITVTGAGPAIQSISNVVLTSETSGQATVTVPAPGVLGLGTHNGTITVRACLDDATCSRGELRGSPQTVNVTYHVAGLRSSQAALAFTIDNAPAATDMTRQTAITGIPAQSWTASTDAQWLRVTPAGAHGGALTADLAPSAVEALTNGVYNASVTVTGETPSRRIVIPATLTIRRTQIDHVTPYVAYTGTSDAVIISGEALSQVSIQGVMFGSTPAASFSLVSPTEIRATYPSSLPPGRHRVRLQSDSTVIRELAELVVVDAPVFSAAALPLPTPGSQAPYGLVYDAERAAVGINIWYYNGRTGLVRFVHDGQNWSSPSVTLLSNMFAMVLAADGSEWVVGTNRSIAHLDADDLTTVTTVMSPISSDDTRWVRELAVARDGTVAVFGNDYYGCGADMLLYKPRNRTFARLPWAYCRGTAGVSADGARLVIGEMFGSNPSDISLLDASTGVRTPTGLIQQLSSTPVLDRTGSRIIIDKTHVYDGSFALLGNLPATPAAVVLHPDGSRAYTYAESFMRVYDLTAAPVGGLFPQLGPDIALAGNPGYEDVKMAITPDGRTVFITAGSALIVQPTP